MKLCVIVPSADYLKQAGVRIRYERLRRHLATCGTALHVKVVDEIGFSDLRDCEVYIFSKLLDVRSIVLAREMTAAGRVIGIDLFDDYFSQTDDSRFVRMREWGRAIAPLVHFVLCSTPRMAEVGAAMVPAVPCIVLNDPHDQFDTERLASRIETKLARCRAERVISVGWFGIGDNPHFPVGLADLSAFSGTLARLAGGEFRVELEIMTNRRALLADGLESLRRLSVPYRLFEWSASAESALIDRSLACMLPVNGQLFSIAKSLNRAVSTLTGGAQVLSVGYPLYERLDEFIYRTPAALLSSIRDGELRLHRATLPAFVTLMGELGHPQKEAEHLAVALEELAAKHLRKPGKRPRLAVLHGHRHAESAHNLAQRLGHVSAASPLCLSKHRHDVKFTLRKESGELEARLSTRAQRQLADGIAVPRDGNGEAIATQHFTLRDQRGAVRRVPGYRPGSSGARIASFNAVMGACVQALTSLYVGIDVLVGEHEPPLYLPDVPLEPLAPVVCPPAIIAMPDRYEARPEPLIGDLRYAMSTELAGSIIVTERDLRRHDVAIARGEVAAKLDLALADQQPGAIVVAHHSGRLVKEMLILAERRSLPLVALIDAAMVDLIDPEHRAGDAQAIARRASVARKLLNRATLILCLEEAVAERTAALFPDAVPSTVLPQDGTAAAMIAAIQRLSATGRQAPVATKARAA